jgi:hypothetical protein
VIPYISGEEEKVQRETQKILGAFNDGSIHLPTSRFRYMHTRWSTRWPYRSRVRRDGKAVFCG